MVLGRIVLPTLRLFTGVEVVEPMPGREGELSAQPSNRWRIQEHKDNSQRADRNSTKLEVLLGVEQVAKEYPGQLQEEYKDLDRDKPRPVTNTMRDPQSTTSRADARAIRGTIARRAKRRYRAHENVRCRRANKVPVSPGRRPAVLQRSIQQTTQPKSLSSLWGHSYGGLLERQKI